IQSFSARSAVTDSGLLPTMPLDPPVSGIVNALVLLDSPAALETVPGANLSLNAASAAAATVRAQQRAVSAELDSIGGIDVTGSLQFTANALAVSLDASQVRAVEALPGVKAVVLDQIGTLDNANSVPFINTIQAWEA